MKISTQEIKAKLAKTKTDPLILRPILYKAKIGHTGKLKEYPKFYVERKLKVFVVQEKVDAKTKQTFTDIEKAVETYNGIK